MRPGPASLKSLLGIPCLIACFMLLSACGTAQRPAPSRPNYSYGQEIRDLRTMPQNLESYLGSDRNQPILSRSEAASAMSKWNTRFFSSWHMSKPSISRKEAELMLKRKARGWKNGRSQWQDHEWQAMRSNAGMNSWPNTNAKGITIRSANLREMPTTEGRYSEPTSNPRENPFDLFQYSRLPMGMPVLLCHKSRDGRWYYAETPLASGWIAANDLAIVTDSFADAWEGAAKAAFIEENIPLAGGRTGEIGVVLPSAGANAVMIPTRDSQGYAAMKAVQVPGGSTASMPMTMTPANVASLGNKMIGQKYGWGGMLGLRDCSSMTRDLMTPFGIWLPRNSQAQARAGNQISLSGLSGASAKERAVLAQGVPFASLLTLKGHVTFYVGSYKGRPVILHDLWGIRVDEGPGEDDRLIIGRVVVTGMTPGAELPNLHNNSTIGDRFHSLTILGGSPR